MRLISYLFMFGGLVVANMTLQAQDNKFLDDAYVSRDEVKVRQTKAKEKAARQRAAYEAQQRKWRAEQEQREQEFLKRQRSREIDAYNGHLSAEDSLLLSEYRRREAQAYADEVPAEGYGEYSRRLKRFYGDNNVIVINNPRSVYVDHDYDDWSWRHRASWGGWGSYDPWYDDYYYPSRYRFSWSWGWGGSRFGYYDPWYGGRYGYYGAYYDPWYGGYYGSWGGYYPYSWSYYPGYYSVPVVTYRNNAYRAGSRSDASFQPINNPYRGSYGAYEATRTGIERGRTVYYGTGYRGYDDRATSSYGTRSTSGARSYDVQRESARSVYTEPMNNGSTYSAPARSYNGGSSGATRGRR